MERKIKRIFDALNGEIIYSDEEKRIYNLVYEEYINNKEKVLFMDVYSRKCECISIKEMSDKLYSMEEFDGEITEAGLDRKIFDDCVFYMEVKVLKYFGKNVAEIEEIMNLGK